jgi:hypothetical protein
MRVETFGAATLYLGDSREVLPLVGEAHALITDPVWPNCPPGLIPGSEDPAGLWDAAVKAMPALRRMVVVMRHDSDPRFLQPIDLPYARAVILPYVMPGYIGRYLGGDEIDPIFFDIACRRIETETLRPKLPIEEPLHQLDMIAVTPQERDRV